MSKPTLKEIANTLGLSIATVSKALKGYSDISIETKQKVKNLAEQLNYKPNSYAQSLQSKESKTIGLIVPEVVHHFFSNVILGIVKTAEKHGYLVITLQSDEKYEVEKSQIELLLNKNVDAILMSLADNTVDYKHIESIRNTGIPVVLFDKISKLIDCHKVVINDEKAAFEATNYLIKTGCKKIAHIRGVLKPQTTIDRLRGYRKALEHNDIEFEKNLVFEATNLSLEDGQRIAQTIFDKHKDVDGVFVLTDLIASGMLMKFNELGVKVPEEISVIGFSNWLITQLTTPTLSTVDQPGFKMGQVAFNLLLDEIYNLKNNKEVNYRTIEIPTKVIARNSTKFI
ncbi:MAG TPA: LacI family transcriptional regulator [Flavobacteriaceae bacterium]|nr:LacI family transcriptional regulator [Flavobacteriaceae bacterium]